MAQLFAWLLAAAWPIAKKVLVMLGIGFVTYEGLTTLLNNVISHAQTNWSQMPASTLSLLSMLGASDAIGIICGAMVARLSYAVVGRLTKIATS